MAKMKPKLSREDFVVLHSSLLEEERKAEVSFAQSQDEALTVKELESRGVVVSRLVIKERSTGLYGRPMFTFCSSKKDATLPTNNFSSGDIIGVHQCGTTDRIQLTAGVVTRVSQSIIQIVLEEDADELDSISDDSLFRLHKLANDVTYKRIKKSLVELEKLVGGRSSHLVSVLFGETAPKSTISVLPNQLLQENNEINLFNQKLDRSQREAVEFAIKRSDLAIIHGPPGTGKTTTVVEIIRQHIKLKSKVLACAPSNLAVDNLVERLAAAGVRVVRIGHPARVTQLTQRHTLDAIMHNCEEAGLLSDIHKDINEQLGKLKKAKDKGKRHYIRKEIKTFRKELRERETRLTKQILTSCDVILATLTSSGSEGPLRHLPPEHIDLVVIDECSQAIEAACYQSIFHAPKMVIAGDHCQLPPTILSTEAATKGLELSLMERLIDLYGDVVVKMLTVQYRMNSLIMNWASAALYDNQLTAHSSVASHLLSQSKGIQLNDDTEHAIVMIDTAGCDCLELDTPEEQSKGNRNEAIIVSCHVKNLLAAGVPEEDIAVITPYNLQVDLIRSLIRNSHPKVEVRSVDGFQGREKEAVVMSLVRSNTEGRVGFLSENRRLNVAVTRARRHLCIVCDTDTVGQHSFLKSLVDYVSDHGFVRTAHEFQNEIDTIDVEIPESVILVPKSSSSDVRRNDSKRSSNSRQDSKPRPKKNAKPPPPPSEEENKKRREEYEEIIQRFAKSTSPTHSFPPNLNSFERRLIHEIAGNLGLLHESQGEGKDRFIVIRKPEGKEIGLDKKGGSNEELSAEDSAESEEEVDSLRLEYEEIIDHFLDSPAPTYKFPANLNSFERQLIHTIADERGLKHESIGEAKKRCIVIHSKKIPKSKQANSQRDQTACSSVVESKRGDTVVETNKSIELNSSNSGVLTNNSKSCNTGAIPKSKVINESANTKSNVEVRTQTRFINGMYQEVTISENVSVKKEPTTRHCKSCGKDILVQNYTVHSVHCEKQKALKNDQPKNNAKKNDKKAKKKEKTKPGEEEDFDTLIQQFTKENDHCSQPQCKTRTTVIFQLCPFCRNTFCLAHHMAEIHGCGDQARQRARMLISKEGVLYPGSGIPSKKPPSDKRKQMQRKLDKKMDELGSQRKAKQSSKDKDKK